MDREYSHVLGHTEVCVEYQFVDLKIDTKGICRIDLVANMDN